MLTTQSLFIKQLKVMLLLTLSCFMNAAVSKELIVYIEQIPFYSCFANGEANGFSVAILKELAKHSEHNVTFEIVPWARAVKEAKAKDNVLLAVVNRTEQREEHFTWLYQLTPASENYWLWRLKQNTAASHTDLSLLANKRIALTRGGIQKENIEAYLSQHNIQADIYSVTSRAQVYKMLLAGRIDYIAAGVEEIDAELTKLLIDKTKLEKVFSIPKTSKGLYIVLGTNFNSKIRAQLQKVLAQLIANDEIIKIRQHHVNNPQDCINIE